MNHWRFITELRYRLTVCWDELCSGSDCTPAHRWSQSAPVSPERFWLSGPVHMVTVIHTDLDIKGFLVLILTLNDPIESRSNSSHSNISGRQVKLSQHFHMFSLQRFNLWKRHTAHRSEVREKWRIWISSLLRWLDPHSSRCHRLQRQIWTGKYECSCQYEPAETSLTVCVCVCVSLSLSMNEQHDSQPAVLCFICVGEASWLPALLFLVVSAAHWGGGGRKEKRGERGGREGRGEGREGRGEEGEKGGERRERREERGGREETRETRERRGEEDEEEERENRQQCGLNVSGGESLLLQADASRNSPERQMDELNLETNQRLSSRSRHTSPTGTFLDDFIICALFIFNKIKLFLPTIPPSGIRACFCFLMLLTYTICFDIKEQFTQNWPQSSPPPDDMKLQHEQVVQQNAATLFYCDAPELFCGLRHWTFWFLLFL